ncbi:MAG: fatty acid desaturase [Hyphomicrobiaceae bacterium]|jgi:fatty acid desaturase
MSAPINGEAFAHDLDQLRARVMGKLGAEDLTHLKRMERWGRLCTLGGWASAWIAPNPLSAILIAQGRTSRWAMVAHHILHRGYDRVPGVPRERTSKGFAQGRRRLLDWNDWIDPEAWAFEHNQQHHYRLGEDADPDQVELNLDWLRDSKLPAFAKLAIVSFFAATWKWTYYAPNTFRQLRGRRKNQPAARSDLEPLASMYLKPSFWRRCLGPYAIIQFVALPLMFLPLGRWAAFSVLCNSVLAEVITNLHSFLIITTNHAGDDLHAFEARADTRAEFYVRQALGSVNFRTGSNLNDFAHGWLNYQIEHHLFPDLPMRQYQRIQPEVRAICERHGVAYVQSSVWKRLKKTLDVMIGRTDMIRAESIEAISAELATASLVEPAVVTPA